MDISKLINEDLLSAFAEEIKSKFGRKLAFDPTPVHNVTLAETVANVDSDHSYNIILSDYVQNKIKAFWMHITFPGYTQSGTVGSLRCRARYTKADGTEERTCIGQVNNTLSTATRLVNFWDFATYGNIEVFSSVANTNGAGTVYIMGKDTPYQPILIDINQYFLKGVNVYFNSSDIPFPKNTTIIFYIAKEAE